MCKEILDPISEKGLGFYFTGRMPNEIMGAPNSTNKELKFTGHNDLIPILSKIF
jgi:hypothetical protein